MFDFEKYELIHCKSNTKTLQYRPAPRLLNLMSPFCSTIFIFEIDDQFLRNANIYYMLNDFMLNIAGYDDTILR